LIRKINIDKERIKQQKIYDKKIKEITKLKDTLVDKERRYFEKREVEKLKVKFIQVKATLTELI
jgi:hypothetical protein